MSLHTVKTAHISKYVAVFTFQSIFIFHLSYYIYYILPLWITPRPLQESYKQLTAKQMCRFVVEHALEY